MRQKRKRKIIKTIPKKKYVQKPPHKGTFWSEYSFAIIAFFFMVFVSFLLYYSSLPEHYSSKVSLGYTRQNIPFIKKIKDYGSMYPVTVTYDSHNPQISTIVVE